MAEKKASLIIELKDTASAALKGLQGAIGGLTQSWFAVTGAVAGVTAVMYSALSSYMESEVAVNKLNSALQRQGQYTPELSRHFQELATQLQNVSQYSDEQILSSQSLLINYGLSVSQTEKATKAAMDLATQTGSLESATRLIAKAYEGNAGALGRYGIKISDNIPPTQQFAAVLDEVNKKFGGESARQAETLAGRIAILGNKFDDLKEKLGKELMPVAEAWLKWADTAVNKVGTLMGAEQADISMREHKVKALKDQLATFIETTTQEGTYNDALTQKRIKNIQDLILAEEDAGKRHQAVQEKNLAEQLAADKDRESTLAKEEQEKQDLEFEKKLLGLQGYQNKALLLETEYQAKKLRTSNNAENKERLLTALHYKLQTEAALQFFSNVSSLQSAKTKEIALIGKAAAIAEATIRGILAVQQAISSPPGPPWSLALAASIGVMTAGNVAKIAGVSFAEGGMALPTAGGTYANIAEAGKAEAVIPLDDPRTKEKLADVFGGNTIVINAGTIVANDYDMIELAKKIDEELYKLGRNRKAVSI